MVTEKLTEWLDNSPDYGIFAPPMDAQTAVNFLQRYLLGEKWYCVDPVSNKQINTVIVYEILFKYSRAFRKELRKRNGK